jgi:hypothetical protein
VLKAGFYEQKRGLPGVRKNVTGYSCAATGYGFNLTNALKSDKKTLEANMASEPPKVFISLARRHTAASFFS